MTLKDMHDIPRHTPEPLASFRQWANEEQHGWDHQLRWARVLLAFDYEWEGYCGKRMEDVFRQAERDGPMSYEDCLKWYEHHRRNKRWTAARKHYESEAELTDDDKLEREAQAKRDEEMRWYKYAPPMQAHYTYEEYVKLFGSQPEICLVLGWGKKAIIDKSIDCPIYWLEGDQEYPATRCFKYDNEAKDWIDLDAAREPEEAAEMTQDQLFDQALFDKDWATVARIATERANAG